MKPGRHSNWPHYLPMAYFGFFLWPPYHDGAEPEQWAFTVLGTVLFVVLYVSALRLKKRIWRLISLGIMVALGAAYAPFNLAANCFFIFAAALLGHVVETEAGFGKGLAANLLVVGLTTWWAHLPGWFLVFTGGVSAVAGVSSFYLHQRERIYRKLSAANAEIEHLAKVAERERIARDLHDVLGHTLSVIILKSELARRLMDRDPERAKAEIGDVEQSSREALAEVRSTIRGYRVNSLEAELAQAKRALEAAGVEVKTEAAAVPLSSAQEGVIALAVREAVTNVVRHAQARNCRLRLERVNGRCRLEVQDDGCGGQQPEGHGLRGMRERVEAFGGSLRRETSAGTKLCVEIPLAETGKGNGF